MCFISCDICGEELSFTGDHACDMDKVRKIIKDLNEMVRIKDGTMEIIQDGVLLLFSEIPSVEHLQQENIEVKVHWLRMLWDAANGKFNDVEIADSFLSQWIATHLVLSEAFDLFRSKSFRKNHGLLEKLKELKFACDEAKETLGYQDSILDLTPEDIIKNAKE